MLTGGAGFIGSNLCEYLLKQSDCHIINIDALTYAGHSANMASFIDNPRHFFIKANIEDRPLMHSLVEKHKPDCFVHLAAETHVDRSIDSPSVFLRTNVIGTANLLDANFAYWKTLPATKQQQFKFIHVSTDEVFGSIKAPHSFNETTRYDPHSPYAASKAAADHLVRVYKDTYGLPTLVTNCSNNYGPRQFPEKLIPLAIQKILQSEAIPVYGDGKQVRDWIHVTDHCRGLAKVITDGIAGETYLFSSMTPKTNIELLQLLTQILFELSPDIKRRAPKEPFKTVPDRPGHDARYALDSTKTQKKLNWKPVEPLEKGLEKTIAWYLANLDWCEQVTRNTYKLQRLGISITR